MKKILILADIDSAHTEKWVKALIQHGFKIYLFSLRNSNSTWHQKLTNFNFSSQQESKSNTLTSKLIYFKALPQIKKIIKEFRPDFVHAYYASSYGLLGALLHYHPFYVSVWGSDVFEFPNKSKITKNVLKYVLKKADKIFSTGTVMADEIKKYTAKSIEIVSFGIDTNKFVPINKPNKTSIIQIGVIKTLEQTYGIDVLIKAMAEVVKLHQNIKLSIVGGGSLAQEYKMLAVHLKLDKFIDFIGKIPYNEIVSEYQKLAIFINPSRFESFGVSILEASACGLPVIATKAGGQIELVKENETGLLVEPENVKQLAKSIITLIENEKMREKYGENARLFVLKNYQLNTSIQQLLKHY